MSLSSDSAVACPGTVLHVGCGGEHITDGVLAAYAETRLDIDPNMKPDIVASMTDMGDIGPFDMVYSSHSLEHLTPEGVDQALAEFLRVLKPGGGVLIFVPDTEGVEANDEVLYEAPCGPITGRDLIFGLDIPAQPYMRHLTGFVRDTLELALARAGFSAVYVKRIDCYNLIAAARK